MFSLATDDLAVKPYIPYKVYYNEFVANAKGSKKSVSILRKKMEAILDSNIKIVTSMHEFGKIFLVSKCGRICIAMKARNRTENISREVKNFRKNQDI